MAASAAGVGKGRPGWAPVFFRPKMRKEGEPRGLDPDRWFNNVETVTAERIGIETTTCVRNIFKHDVSYKLIVEAKANAAKLREQAVPAKQ